MRPRAAAPKITRLLRWPVRPNCCVAITRRPYAEPARRAQGLRRGDDSIPRSTSALPPRPPSSSSSLGGGSTLTLLVTNDGVRREWIQHDQLLTRFRCRRPTRVGEVRP